MRDLSQIDRLPVLAGDAVVLRPWRLRDAADVAALCDDESVSRWMPLMPHPYTLADGEEWVGDAARKWREDRWANFAAVDPVTRSLVGSCGVRIDREKESGEIGYLVHRDRRRRGIASACVALLTDWAFDDLGLGRLQIRADTRNVGLTAHHRRLRLPLRGSAARRRRRRRRARRRRAVRAGAGRPAAAATRLGGGCRRRALAARPRLAAAHRRPRGGPALRAGRRRGRPSGRRRPRRRALDPGVPSPYTMAAAEQFIADATHRLLLGERARLVVADAEGGELLGSVSLDLFADRQAAEIGYWVKRQARRMGVALAAARLVVDWAFDEVGVERLELLTYPGNEASQALAGRLGFTRECLLRGFLPPEAGKSREGRVVPSADGSLPPRDDQVQFARLRSDASAGRLRAHAKEPPNLAAPAALSGLSPERLSPIRRTVSM